MISHNQEAQILHETKDRWRDVCCNGKLFMPHRLVQYYSCEALFTNRCKKNIWLTNKNIDIKFSTYTTRFLNNTRYADDGNIEKPNNLVIVESNKAKDLNGMAEIS
jgi:hypothetical protein